MATVRETLLGIVDAASDALDRIRDCGSRSSELEQHADEALAMSNGSSAPHIDGNGLGHLEMAVSLASSHFQHIGWK
jgi:hypothetical protein